MSSVLKTHRFGAFLAVGVLGFVLQIAALSALTLIAGWRWLPATIVSVELAVLHNFCWHRRWTWRDRQAVSSGEGLVRFHLSNGVASMLGNAGLMALLVGIAGLPPIGANILAVGAMSLANFALADRWVFGHGGAVKLRSPNSDTGTPTLELRHRNSDTGTPTLELRHRNSDTGTPDTGTPTLELRHRNSDTGTPTLELRHRNSDTRTPTLGCAAILMVAWLPAAAAAAGPPAQTLNAWERHVAATEARLDFPRWSPERTATGADIVAQGESIHVPDGTISDWRGSIFIPGVTLDQLLHGLQYPGTPPPQEDVVSSRVLARSGDSLRVAIRLVRRAIVTVSYDTEHEMQFRRLTPTVAVARSVATRIDEVGGSDHGFLWRLHSYWKYEQADGGVRVDLRSLTLSRNVPSLVRPIAAPLVNRVARESIVRTLDALRRYLVRDGGTA